MQFVHVSRGASGETSFWDIDAQFDAWYQRTGRRAFLERPDHYVFGTAENIEDVPALIDELASTLAQYGWRDAYATEPRMTGRIDTHSHFVPAEYRDWLHSKPNFPGPFIEWSREAAIEFYDRNGIATGILSISSPGVRLGAGQDASETLRISRMVNDAAAEVVRSAPDRFGFFASLALPDVDGSIAEATYALEQLGADGVVLMTNTDGVYLGAPEFDPLFEFLDEHNCVVFVHPTVPVGARAAGLSPGVVDFVADTVRCATSLAASGTLSRHPGLRVILSHGGGFLPYTALRIANMAFPGRDPLEAVEEFRRFYFDTALASSEYTLPSLAAFAQPGHLTFGTDWPYANTAQASAFTDELDARGLDPDTADAINFASAKQLFPRLAAAKG